MDSMKPKKDEADRSSGGSPYCVVQVAGSGTLQDREKRSYRERKIFLEKIGVQLQADMAEATKADMNKNKWWMPWVQLAVGLVTCGGVFWTVWLHYSH